MVRCLKIHFDGCECLLASVRLKKMKPRLCIECLTHICNRMRSRIAAVFAETFQQLHGSLTTLDTVS